MNNILTNAITLLLLLTLYGITYRVVSAGFRILSKHRDAKKAAQENLLRLENIKLTLCALSHEEIATIKFILEQNSHIAWLPNDSLIAIQLEAKSILRNIDPSRTKFVDKWHNKIRGITCYPYGVDDEILTLITQLPQEFHNRWRKVKPDKTLQEYQ